ncbi:hypothetical protein H0X06_01120 [Candidatus Dependentiae bacterium]|nr:hypothetical protein [Candidatus Dependentiae bacterium]
MVKKYTAVSLLCMMSSCAITYAKQDYKELSAAVQQGDVERTTYLLKRDGALDEIIRECLLIKAEKRTEQVLKSAHFYTQVFSYVRFLGGAFVVSDIYRDLNKLHNEPFFEENQALKSTSIMPFLMKLYIAYSGYLTAKQGMHYVAVERVAAAQAIETLIKNADLLPKE